MVPFPSPCGKQRDFSLLFTMGTREPLEMKLTKVPLPPGLGPLLFSPLDLVFTEPPAICPSPFRLPCPALAPVAVSAPCPLPPATHSPITLLALGAAVCSVPHLAERSKKRCCVLSLSSF